MRTESEFVFEFTGNGFENEQCLLDNFGADTVTGQKDNVGFQGISSLIARGMDAFDRDNLAEPLDLLYRRTVIAAGLSMTGAIGIFGPVQKVPGSPQLLAPILAA